MPGNVAPVMASWQACPDYRSVRMDRGNAIDFLSKRYYPAFVRAFRLANKVAEECDFLRLSWLCAEGGIHADDRPIGDANRWPRGQGRIRGVSR